MSMMMSMVGELVVMAVGGSALIGANAMSRRNARVRHGLRGV